MQKEFRHLADAYAWLDAHINFERRLGSLAYDERTFALEQFSRRLEKLENPQIMPHTVHIAGSRGKGSAAWFLEALLRASGARTALFTSPHVREYRERVRIDGQILSAELTLDLMSRLAQLNRDSDPEPPQTFKTVFETLTALFFLAARETSADWAIVETGLGGRLDATNVLPAGPVLLTRIGWDHTHLLGDSLAAIAAEKAAILKRGGWAVAGRQDDDGEALAVFEDRANQTGSVLFYAPDMCPIEHLQCHHEGLRLRIGFGNGSLDLDLPIFGEYQAENLQNALAMFNRLCVSGLVQPIEPARIAKILAGVAVPGRMERVSQWPEVFVDGGHCPTAAAAVARTMEAHFGQEPADLLVGMMADKDHQGFFRNLAAWSGWRYVICIRSPGLRSAAPEILAEAARPFFPQVRVMSNAQSALEFLGQGDDKKTRAVGVGSLYNISQYEDWGVKRVR